MYCRMLVLISVTFVLLNVKIVCGYASYCDVNQTLFVPKGNSAVLKLNNLTTDYYYTNVWLTKTDRNARNIISIYWRRGEPFTLNAVRFIDTELQNRTEVAFVNSTNVISVIEIRIDDLHLDDNGTYYANFYSGFNKRFCWILLLLDLQQIPSGHISEAQGVRIYGQPAASLMKRPLINATMVWLLDGKLLNETEYFVIQDGAIWTAKIQRVLNAKNITYRAIQDNGTMNEMNFTLHVAYGPDFPLTFSPPKSFHALKAGEILPEIRCAAVCNPTCSVSWGNHSATDVLRLGTVSVASSGEYTCTVKSHGNGTMRAVERSVYLVVTDNSGKEMTAIAVLATIQVLTTLFLGIFAVIVCRHFKSLSWKSCTNTPKICCQHTEDNPVEMSSEINLPREHRQNVHQNSAYVADYVDLNAGTRQNTSESETYSTLEKDGQTLTEISDGETSTELYENTIMSQL